MKLRVALCIVVVSLMLGMAPNASAQDEGTKVDQATFDQLKGTLLIWANAVGHDGQTATTLLTDAALQGAFGSVDRAQAAQQLGDASTIPVKVYSVFNGRIHADGRYSIDFTATGLFSANYLQTRRWFLIKTDGGGFVIDTGGNLLSLRLPKKLHQVPMTAVIQLDSVTVNPANLTIAEGDVLTIAFENTQPEGVYGIAVYRGDEVLGRLGRDPGEKDMLGLVDLTPGTYTVNLTQWADDNAPANVMFDIATSFTVQ